MQTVVRLYVCPAWSVTLQKELRLMRYHNRVLRKILWSKRQEGTGDWRKVPNEELQDLFCSPNITQVIKIRRIRWGGPCSMGEKRKAVLTLTLILLTWRIW